jgi:hypothetical protein
MTLNDMPACYLYSMIVRHLGCLNSPLDGGQKFSSGCRQPGVQAVGCTQLAVTRVAALYLVSVALVS